MANITIPTADAQTLGLLALAFLAGATAPTYYAQERLRGFGRFVASKLPYRAPPGREEQEAMVEATDDAQDTADGQGGER